MIYAVFFCAGIVIGLAVAVPVLMIFWQGAHKAAQFKVQSDAISASATILNAQKKVEESIKRLRAEHPDMSREQEEVARDIFVSRYAQKPPEMRPTPVSKG